MITHKYFSWWLFAIVILTGVSSICQAANELVPEDTCIIELTLPEGSTVKLQGKDYGTKRKMTYRELTRRKTYQVPLEIHFPSGKTSEYKLLLRGGHRVRLARLDPRSVLPEFVGQRFTIGCGGFPLCEFSPDETKMLLYDQDAVLYSVSNGRLLRSFDPDGFAPAEVCRQPITAHFVSNTELMIWPNIWNVKNGLSIRPLAGGGNADEPLAISSDSKYYLTNSGENAVVLCETGNGRRIRTFKGHTGRVAFASFSHDGRYILTSSDRTAILWDVARGRRVNTFKAEGKWVSFAVSSQAKFVCAAASTDWDLSISDHFVVLWDAFTGKKVSEYKNADRCALSPDERSILICSAGNKAVHRDITTGNELHTFHGMDPLGGIGARFSPSGRYIATMDLGGTIIWNSDSGKPVARIPSLQPRYRLLIGPHGRLIACHRLSYDGNYGKVSLLNASSGCSRRLKGAGRPLCFSPCGQILITQSHSKTVIAWDVHTGQRLRDFEQSSDIWHAAFSPDSQELLTSSTDESYLWNIATGQKLWTFQEQHLRLIPVAFSPDGKHLLATGDGKIALLDFSHTDASRISGDTSTSVGSVAFGHDGRNALIGSRDGIITMWDTQSERRIRTIGTSGHTQGGAGDDAQMSTYASEYVASASHVDANVRLWDTRSGELVRTFQGHTGQILDCQVCDSTDILVASGYDDLVIYWDLATGLQLATLALTPDGIVVSTPEGLFDGSPEAINKICYRIGDGLNVVPVERFFQDFYRPGLLAAILRGERPLPTVEIGKQLPPEVCILAPKQSAATEEDSVTIEAVIEDKGGGIKRPWVRQNGTQVEVNSKPVRDGDKLRWKFDLPLVDGENTIEVQSASADGSWESEPARIVLTRARPTEKTQLYLLAVGVSKYADETADLQYAAADAEAMANLFRTRGTQCYGEGRVHVNTLLDDQATTKNIEKAIATIAEQAKPQDVFMLTLSGHGIMVGQRYYFLPHELITKGTRGWEDAAKRYGLPGDVLQTWITKVPALKRVVVYDTCQSGGAVAIAGLSRNPFEFQRAFETFRRSTGCHIIAAATATKNAEEISEIGHGALTYALLAGLGAVDRGPLKNRTVKSTDGLVQVRDWLAYAQENVPTLTKLYYGHEQLVNVFGEGRSFPILRVEKEKP